MESGRILIAEDDPITGEFRPLNLKLRPFNFPLSYFDVQENSMDAPEYFGSKCLSLYRVKDLPSYNIYD